MPAIPRKLTPETVVKLRALGKFVEAGITTQRALADHFGLSQSTVSNILSGSMWAICPTVEWKPQVLLTDLKKVQEAAHRFGGVVATSKGVVTLPAPDAETSDDDSEAA